MKIPVDQQFLKYSDQPVWHQQPFHIQSHLNPLSSPFWCSVWTSESHLHHIQMPKCIELLPCDWLIGNLCYKAIEQVYLIKWPVSVYVSAGQWLIMINRIHNKTFCVHNICTVYIYYVFINTYTCMHIFNTNMLCLYLHLHFTFSNFVDAFIQTDLQLGNT